MNYSKPELIIVGPAVSQVQGTRKEGLFLEASTSRPEDTIAAYEADE